MCEKELIVSYLYDDLGDADRARFDTHLRDCAECRAELNALRGVRADLMSWSPPQPDFGFRIVREPDVSSVVEMTPRSARRPSWRAWWTPAAGLAAAAVLVLAAAAGLARIEFHSGPDGITVRTGWGSAPDSALASSRSAGEAGRSGDAAVKADTARPVAAAAPSTDPAFLRALDERLSALESASRAATGMRAASMPAMSSARTSDAEIIRRVREMLAQSETKQQGELALRIAQVIRDVDAQRVADLAQIQKGLRGIEASVSAEGAQHRELTSYILTSARQK